MLHVSYFMLHEIEPACPHAGVCGGCLWQHLRYETQQQLKRDAVNLALKEAGHAEQITSIVPCPDPFYYRNRMDYTMGWKGEVGLKKKGSWNHYVDLTTCLLLDKETPNTLEQVRALMQECHVPPWDVKFHRGLMRYCVIRCGKNTGERMVTLVVKDLSAITHYSLRITERLAPLCTTLYLGENPEITDLSICKTFQLLHGPKYLTEEVNGIRYHIHPNSFFQTNTVMAGELQKTVLAFAGTPRSLLDLYCGLGFFAIATAKQGSMVRGYELDAQAIELAKINAALNGVADRTNFEAGAIEKLLPIISSDETVIIDPPRSGLHPKVLDTLLTAKPKTIVYVSCKYQTFVKELTQFKSLYRVEKMEALDLFPQTPHVELVTKLVLR
ncbi:23S rRNA (uracil(1939)-C(5))-methyltransferase RlmD [Candidatus Uhrbacteria bacterium]|nr:23S rRNA (uracil(1939)-C(5))-methyltransferase RlmD [Candidatus Uhrbacteria bacterium]